MPDYIVKPYDVLFFRGLKSFHFGEWYTEGIFPPYPSTFQGFIRSKMLHDGNCFESKGKLRNKLNAENIVGNDARMTIDIIGPYIINAQTGKIYFKTPKDLMRNAEGCNVYHSVFPEMNETFESDMGIIMSCPNIPDGKLDKHYPNEHESISLDEILKYRLILNGITIEGDEYYCSEDRVGIALKTMKLWSGDRMVQDNRFYVTQYKRLKSDIGFYCNVNKPDDASPIKCGSLKFGSESHLVHVESLGTNDVLEESFKGSREDLVSQILMTKTFRLILLQHGVFENGWMPFSYIVENRRLIVSPEGADIKLELIYALTDAPVRISGYSYEKSNVDEIQKEIKLKPMMNAVPAGSVYMFKIKEGCSDEQIRRFVTKYDNQIIKNLPYSKMGFNHVILACGAKLL